MARITHTGGRHFINAPAAFGEALYSLPAPVGIYGGEVTLLVSAGVFGLLTVIGSMDLGASWSHVFVGPLRIPPDDGVQTVRFSTLDPAAGHSGCTHYRVKFEVPPCSPHVEVMHIGGCGQEYRNNPELLPSGVLQPMARLKRWVSNLRTR